MRSAILIAVVLAGSPLFSRGRGPVQAGGSGANLSARACRSCHPGTYEEWSRSRHAQAWSNPLFAESFRDHPSTWCVHCHAPLVEQRAQVFPEQAPAPALRDEGVNCAACHLREGTLLSGRAPSEAARQAHPIRHEPALQTADFCGGCHEFPMPDFEAPGWPDTSVPMQKTVTEWQVSAAARAGETCQACHMAGGAHDVPGAHDLGFVRRALEVGWRWSGRSRLCAEIRARNVGHAVPTGDPFRRLRLRVCRDEACRAPAGTRVLARSIERVEKDVIERTDTRLATTERRECFEIPQGTAAPTHWMLEILYAEPQIEARLPDSVTRAVIAGGPLPAATK